MDTFEIAEFLFADETQSAADQCCTDAVDELIASFTPQQVLRSLFYYIDGCWSDLGAENSDGADDVETISSLRTIMRRMNHWSVSDGSEEICAFVSFRGEHEIIAVRPTHHECQQICDYHNNCEHVDWNGYPVGTGQPEETFGLAVEVQLRDGLVFTAFADSIEWKSKGESYNDIMHWRIVDESAAKR